MDASPSSQTLADQAKQAYAEADFLKAARLFAQAAELLAADQPLDAAEMRNNQSVALLQGGQAAQALAAVSGTDVLFAQAGDLRRQGLALGNIGAALEELGRLDEAVTYYQQSAGLLDQAGEKEMSALVFKALSALQVRQGKFMDGLNSYQSGLAEVEKPSLKQRILRKLLRLRP